MTATHETCPACAGAVSRTDKFCPSCGRGLGGYTAAQPPAAGQNPLTKQRRLGGVGKGLLILAIVLGVPYFILTQSADHQRYLAFSEQRDAWHRKCDAYREVREGDPREPIAAACARELAELTAYAKRQGWTK